MKTHIDLPGFGGPGASPEQQDAIQKLLTKEVNAERLAGATHDVHGQIHQRFGNLDELTVDGSSMS